MKTTLLRVSLYVIFFLQVFTSCKESTPDKTTIATLKPDCNYVIKQEDAIQQIDTATLRQCDTPVLVWKSDSEPDSLNHQPAIFYSPHQDDETIGMGASIAEHVRLGRLVFVVLLSRGENDNMLLYLKTLRPDSKMQNVVDGRNNEFMAACKKLGVHRVYISNKGKGHKECAKDAMVEKFKKTINFFRLLYPKASHKTASGCRDSYNSFCERHPTHMAAEEALYDFYKQKLISDIRLYRVYIYYNNYTKKDGNACYTEADWKKKIDERDQEVKERAIDEYKYVNAAEHRYGLGYHRSVKELFDNSLESEYEYIDHIKNICK